MEQIPENLGRRFARASGDLNPHHLYAWTAKLLGYKKPVAHGMWTMARCLAHLQNSGLVTTIETARVQDQKLQLNSNIIHESLI